MRNIRGNKTFTRIIEYLEYLFVFVIIVECNSMYTSARLTDGGTAVDRVFLWMTLALLGVLVAAEVLRSWRRLGGVKAYAPFWLLIGATVVAFYFLNVQARVEAAQIDYIYKFMVFLPLLIALFKLKQLRGQGLDLLYKHANVVCVIAALSLQVYLSSLFHVNTMPSDAIYTTWSDAGHVHERVNLLNVCQFVAGGKWQVSGISLLRNNGFYVEPLMFSIPLITALCTELFLRPRSDHYSIYRALLLSIVLVTANATICMALMAIVWGLKGISSSVEHRKRWLAALIACAMLAACVFLVVQKKSLSYESTEVSGSSLADHIEDYRASIKAFLSSPLLGGGYKRGAYIRQFMDPAKLARNPGLSNSAGLILGEGGLMLGLLCLMPFVIGLLYIFRKRDRRMALWTVGPLGLCVGVIFLFKFFLLFLVALGFSLVELRRVEGKGFPFRIGLADLGLDAEEDGTAPARDLKRGRAAALRNAGIFVLCCAALVWLGTPVWQMIHNFLRSHQLSMSQSPLKAFCLNIVLLHQGCCVYSVARRQLDWKRLAALAVWDAAFLLAYPKLYSDIVTLLPAAVLNGKLWECAAILCAYFVGAGLVLHFEPKACLDLRRSAAAYGIVIASVALFVIAQVRIGQIAGAESALAGPLRQLTEAASGAVYTTEQPSAARRLNGGVSYAATDNSGFDAYENVSVVCREGTDRPELFEKGFQVARLADGCLVYSDDEAAISSLAAQGFEFHRYYPYETAVDLGNLAGLNRMKLSKDGTLVIKKGKSLKKGPSDTLRKGQYTLYYALRISLKQYKDAAPDAVVCTLQVSRYSGKEIIAQKDVTLEQFDDTGRATVSLPFTLGTVTNAIRYSLIGNGQGAVRLESLNLKQTPDYITVTDYDCHRNRIRAEYYDIAGQPYVKQGGYAAEAWEYDLGDLLIRYRCFGRDGQPILNTSGYAEARYGYNSMRRRSSESYYGVDGDPIMIKAHYASVRTDYDAYGNVVRVRYYDTDNNLTVASGGYAELVREYNSKKQLVRESYLDADGTPLIQTTGQYEMEQEYDEDGNVVRRWFLRNGVPVMRTDGYAEVRWQYNDLRQIVREAFFDTEGRPVMITGGYAADERAYDDAGNVVVWRYLDTEDKPVMTTSGYAELRREFNQNRQVIREEYVGADGEPMIQTSGFSGMEQEYDDAGNIIARRFFDPNGPVLRTDGYAEVRWKYNGLHQIIREEFFGTDGEPVMIFNGYAADEREYDAAGNVTVYRYYNEYGEPTCMTSAPSYAELHRVYNERRWIVREEYRGSDGQPMLVYGGYASFERDYTEQGTVKAQRHYGLSGEPILIDDGYFEARREYDEAGHAIRETYYDTQGSLIACAKGYAEIRSTYNEFDQLLEEAFFTADGAPAVVGAGYTRIVYEYDDNRQLSLACYLDADGNTAQAGSGYLHEYLQSLIDSDYTIIIAAKDEATNALTPVLLDDLRKLGIGIDLRGRYRNSFYALITPDHVYEDITAQGILSLEQDIEGVHYSITSAGFQVGNYSSIVIDGIEYSKNRRGINVVLYDRSKGAVADSVSFDTHLQEMTVTR